MARDTLMISLRRAARLFGVRPQFLARWANEGIVPPSIANSSTGVSRRVYSYDDLVALKLALKLRREHKVPLAEIEKTFRWLRDERAFLLADARIWVSGRRVYFEDPWSELVHAGMNPPQTAMTAVLDISEVEGSLRSELAEHLAKRFGTPGRTSRTRGVVGGAEVFQGTRIPVQTVVNWVQSGSSDEEILSQYPGLSQEDIRVARSRSTQEAAGPALAK